MVTVERHGHRGAQLELGAHPGRRFHAVDPDPGAHHVQVRFRIQDRTGAVFAAWSMPGSWPAARAAIDRPLEAIELILRRRRRPPSSRDGSTTRRGRTRGRARGRGTRSARPGATHPTRCIPVSIFTWTPTRARAAASCSRSQGRAGCTATASGRRPERARSVPAGNSDSTRIGASMPARRRARPSSTNATPSHAAPPSRAARATCDGAVPVAVGLHHGHEIGAIGPERPDVVADRVEIDLDPGGSDPAPARRSCARAPGAPHRGSGRRCRRPGCPRQRPAREHPGDPVEIGAGRGRVGGLEPAREEPADHAGEHVAGARGGQHRDPVGLIDARPSGVGDMVGCPSTARPLGASAASSRTAAEAIGRRAPRVHAGQPPELSDVRA